MNILDIFKKRPSIKLKINEWSKVSINDYVAIRDIILSKLLTDEQKNVSLLAILQKCSEEDIENMKIGEISSLINQLGWIKSFDFPKNKKYSSLMVGKYKCKVVTNMSEWNYAQYVDFQCVWGNGDIADNYGKVLACFLIPTGATYNKGYSVDELAAEIEDKVSITDANGLVFFFLKQSMSLIRAMQIYLALLMKKMKRKNKSNPQMVEQMSLLMEQMKKAQEYIIGSR